MWEKFAKEILAVDRVDARPLVRPSTVDQSLSLPARWTTLARSLLLPEDSVFGVWIHHETRVCLSATCDL